VTIHGIPGGVVQKYLLDVPAAMRRRLASDWDRIYGERTNSGVFLEINTGENLYHGTRKLNQRAKGCLSFVGQ